MSTRPVFRVASAGLDPRDVRLIGIVFQHSQYNKYDFRMLDVLDLGCTDILIANPVDPAGLDALASLPSAGRLIPSVYAVPRGAQATARYSVTIDRLTLQLLPILNRAVEAERLQPAVVVAQSEPESQAAAEAAGVPAAASSSTSEPGPDGGPAGQAAAASTEGTFQATADGRADGTFSAEPTQALGGTAPSQALVEIPVLEQQPGAGEPEIPPATQMLPVLRTGDLPLVPMMAGATAEAAEAADAASIVSEAAATAIALVAERASHGPWHRPAPPAYQPWNGQAQQAPTRARLQVLVADPSPAAQQQLARALGRMGLEVHCVSGVATALQRIAMQYTDLVITESGLSDGNGFELIRRMRARAAYRYTPVLLLRSRLNVMDATRARLCGDVLVLAKPLTRQALESLVRQALRKSIVLDDLSELLSPA
jgi:two-component system chemotaxis response regulator CheY